MSLKINNVHGPRPTLRVCFAFEMSDMHLLPVQLRSVKVKPTDCESVFDRQRKNFADPGRCVRLCIAEQKAAPDVVPIAAHGLQVRCTVLRPRGRGRQRALPRRAGVEFTVPRASYLDLPPSSPVSKTQNQD
jgi:hypothetical protein